MNREQMIDAIRNYYISIGRNRYPDIDTYSNADLYKCCLLFNLFWSLFFSYIKNSINVFSFSEELKEN